MEFWVGRLISFRVYIHGWSIHEKKHFMPAFRQTFRIKSNHVMNNEVDEKANDAWIRIERCTETKCSKCLLLYCMYICMCNFMYWDYSKSCQSNNPIFMNFIHASFNNYKLIKTCLIWLNLYPTLRHS